MKKNNVFKSAPLRCTSFLFAFAFSFFFFAPEKAHACFNQTTYTNGQNRASALNLANAGCISNGSGETSTQSGVVQNGETNVLNKEGAGTIYISNSSNTYTGGTNISAGTLLIDNSHQLGTSAAVTITGSGNLAFNSSGGLFNNNLTLSTSSLAGLNLRGHTIAYTGSSIGGSGRFYILGGGTLTFQNAFTASYNGMYIQDTEVDVGSINPFGTTDISLNNNGTGAKLRLMNSQTFSNSINSGFDGIQGGSNTLQTDSGVTAIFNAYNGNGTLVKTGAGTLIFNGQSTAISSGSPVAILNVNEGTAEIGDASHTSARFIGNVVVNNGGTFGGHGTVQGNLTNNSGGTVAPGGSIGTTTVTGNYTQGAGSTLQVEVSPTANDVLNVTGTATLAGTLQIVFENGTYTARKITYLNAGTVSGSFTTVTALNVPAGFTFTSGYDPVTGFINLIFGVATPTNATIYTSMTTAQVDASQESNQTVLDRLAGLDFNADPSAPLANTISGGRPLASFGVAEGSANADAIAASVANSVGAYGGWFKASGAFRSLSAQAAAPGFDSQTGGFVTGVDRKLFKNVIVGFGGGYDHIDLSENTTVTSRGTADTARVFIYGATKVDRFTLGGNFGYAHGWVDTERFVSGSGTNATANYGQDVLTASLQASTSEAFGHYTVTPKAGLNFSGVFEDRFTETGAPGFNLTVKNKFTPSVRPFIGASVARAFAFENGMIVTPEMRARYSHEMIGPSRHSYVTVGGTDFTIDGVNPSADTVSLGVGFTAKLNDTIDAFGNYDVNLPTGTTLDHVVSAGAKIRF